MKFPLPQREIKRFAWIFLFRISLITGLGIAMGCQGNIAGRNQNEMLGMNSEDPQLTGWAKELPVAGGMPEMVPYTQAGNGGLVQEIRQQANPETYDPKLGRNIDHAEVNVEKHPNGTPKSVHLSLGMKTHQPGVRKQLEFSVPIKRGQDGLLIGNATGKENSKGSESIPELSNSNFQVGATCLDDNCDQVKLSLQEVHPQKINSPPAQSEAPSSVSPKKDSPPEGEESTPSPSSSPDGQVTREIPLLYTRKPNVARLTVDTLDELPDDLKDLANKNSENITANKDSVTVTLPAQQETIEVLEGPTFVDEKIPSASSDTPALTVKGDMLRTEITSPITSANISGQEVKAQLTGNDENGNIAVQIQSPKSGSQTPGENSPTSESPGLKKPLTVFFETKNTPTAAATSSPAENKTPQPQESPVSSTRPSPPTAKPATKKISPQPPTSRPQPPPTKPTPHATNRSANRSKKTPPATPPTKKTSSPTKPVPSPQQEPLRTQSKKTITPPSTNRPPIRTSVVIPVDFSDPSLREASAMNSQIEKLRNNLFVQRQIGYWTQKNSYRSCGKGRTTDKTKRAEKFFHRIAALAPYATSIFKELDVTPKVLYISALESNYAVNDGWPIETAYCYRNQSCSTATGPYQITETASRYLTKTRRPALNFLFYPFLAGRRAHPQDDRGLFIPATFALAAYAKDLMNWFPKHPELWPLGYTEGQGALAKAMMCAQEKNPQARASCMRSGGAGRAFRERHRYDGTTLDDIVNFKMGPCRSLDYVLDLLALQFIGSNLNQYGMSLDPSRIPKKLPPMYRKGQNASNFIQTMWK